MMKRDIKLMCALGLLFALACLLVLGYADSRQPLVYQASCQKTAAGYVLYFKHSERPNRKLNVLNLRPGKINLRVHPKIEDLEMTTYDDRTERVEKVNGNLFKKTLRKNLVITSIRFFPKLTSVSRVAITIVRKPIYPVFLLGLQFAFLFLLFCTAWLTLHSLYALAVVKQNIATISPRAVLIAILLLFLCFISYFILNLSDFLLLFNFNRPGHFFGRMAMFNAGLAVVLLVLYALFSLKRRGDRLPFFLPLLVALPVTFIKIPFSVAASADSLLWVLNLTFNQMEISFAEALSLMLNKFFFHLAKLIVPIGAETSLVYTGKLVGILFLFSLYYFINSFTALSYKRKLLFFLLFLTFSFNVLLFGFPEFRYYALPFLIFSFLAAKKYLDDARDDLKYLAAAAFLAVVAALFHGTAYFCFPAILLLPLLKHRAGEGEKGKVYRKCYAAILLSVGSVILIFLAAVRLSGYELTFHTAGGGFDGRQFIPLLPLNIHFPDAVNFLETGYFGSRAWMLLISGAFTLLLFVGNWRKRISWALSDFFLLLFGLSQFAIILFWGYDNGISEFDLYLTPLTLLCMLLLRHLSATIGDEKNAWKYIAAFSLFSPVYPLLLKVIGA